MRNKPLFQKIIIFDLLYLLFTLLLIFAVYVIDFFWVTFILGTLYGVVITVVSYCKQIKRTIIAIVTTLLSAVVIQFSLIVLGVPYIIILYILRNNSWVKETGHLTVNEVIGYNWGNMFFWFSLLISLVVSLVSLILFNAIRYRRK